MKKIIIGFVVTIIIVSLGTHVVYGKRDEAKNNPSVQNRKNDVKIEKLKGFEKPDNSRGHANESTNVTGSQKSENAKIFKEKNKDIVDNLEIVGEQVEDMGTYTPEYEQAAEEIEEVADEQEQDAEEIAEAIEQVESRNKWKIMLFGSDYKNLGQLRSSLVRNENQIRKLTKNINRVQGEGEQQVLQEQVATMTQERERIKTVIQENEGGFSLLGWVSRFLAGYDNDPLETVEEEELLEEVAEVVDEEDINIPEDGEIEDEILDEILDE